MRTIHGFTFLHRGQRRHAPTILTSTALPPRELVEPHAEALKLYDELVNLQTAYRDCTKAQGKHIADAAEAEQQHARDLRAAMAAGEDPTKVKNKAEHHRQLAATAEEMARQAKHGADAVGARLGVALHAVADQIAARAEAEVEEAVKDVAQAQAVLAHAQAKWRKAWGARRVFGQFAIFGGSLGNVVHGADAKVDDMTTALETLKFEEQWMREWFAEQDRADEINARRYTTGMPRGGMSA